MDSFGLWHFTIKATYHKLKTMLSMDRLEVTECVCGCPPLMSAILACRNCQPKTKSMLVKVSWVIFTGCPGRLKIYTTQLFLVESKLFQLVNHPKKFYLVKVILTNCRFLIRHGLGESLPHDCWRWCIFFPCLIELVWISWERKRKLKFSPFRCFLPRPTPFLHNYSLRLMSSVGSAASIVVVNLPMRYLELFLSWGREI